MGGITFLNILRPFTPFLFLILGGLSVKSDNQYCVVYDTELKGLVSDSKYNGKMELTFNSTSSLLRHLDFPDSDLYSEEGGTFGITMGDPEGMPIYMDLSRREMTYKFTYSLNKAIFIMKESIPTINWIVSKDHKAIAGLDCIKATGSFGGRKYIVWYTTTIPVPFGPHKLQGLPGLIVEAHSTDGKVKYKLKSIKKEGCSIRIKPPVYGTTVTKDEFNQVVINFEQKMKALADEHGVEIEVNRPDEEGLIDKYLFSRLLDE